MRLDLVLDDEPSELWMKLFEAANPPVRDELTDRYVVHGVKEAEDGTHIYIDLTAHFAFQ